MHPATFINPLRTKGFHLRANRHRNDHYEEGERKIIVAREGVRLILPSPRIRLHKRVRVIGSRSLALPFIRHFLRDISKMISIALERLRN